MAEIYANNVRGKLAEPITPLDTSLPLEAGHSFPDPGTNWYRATLYRWEFTSEGIREFDHEVVKVIGLTLNTLTVERALEGSALAYDPETPIEIRMTAGAMSAVADTPGALPIGTPNWPATLSYNTEGNLTAATYSQGVERYRQSLTYNATGNLATVLYEHSTDSGATYADIGIETLHYDINGNVTHTQWTGA